jgi:hypothetical protein
MSYSYHVFFLKLNGIGRFPDMYYLTYNILHVEVYKKLKYPELLLNISTWLPNLSLYRSWAGFSHSLTNQNSNVLPEGLLSNQQENSNYSTLSFSSM